MIHLFLNGLGASAGAGLTYIYNVVPILSAMPDVRTTLALQPHLRHQFEALPKVTLADARVASAATIRFWFEQRDLPELIRKTGADVLISAGNFALRKSPVPQILLSGNSLYVSADFYRDLRRRNAYGLWLDTQIRGLFAKKSVQWADCTVAPTRAFADQLQGWTGRKVVAVHHGFDQQMFFRDESPISEDIRRQLDASGPYLKLLFVSHYNYYRNFETLFRAIPLIRNQLNGRKLRLFLTCKLEPDKNPGSYKTALAADLIARLGIRDEVVELGAVPYDQLHRLYRSCDIYVTPAYTETFAHPLVEAMANGLPIVASDLAAHREVCGPAAVYFEKFAPDQCAERICDLASHRDLAPKLSVLGKEQATNFSWSRHIDDLLAIARRLVSAPNS